MGSIQELVTESRKAEDQGNGQPPAAAAPEPGPAPEVEHDPVMPVDTEIQAPDFP